MLKKVLITAVMSMIACSAYAQIAEPNDAARRTSRKFPLKEGFVLKGIDGKLSYDRSRDRWSFELDQDLSDGYGLIKAGAKVRLLESAMLEKMVDIHQANDVNDFRLWATTIRYRSRNSFYPLYFLPLSAGTQRQAEKPQTPQADDANDGILPEDVMEKLEPVRAITTEQVSQAIASDEDAMLINRTGFIVYDRKNSRYVFKLDSLGRKVDDTMFILHRSHVVEYIRYQQRRSLSPVRFDVSGRITKFGDKRYILIHSATEAKNFGNFGR